MTESDTVVPMGDRAMISVRLDDEARAALDELVESGMKQSEAIRMALVEAAARRRPRMSLAVEAMMLATSEEDRRESLAVADFMESLRAPGPANAEG